MVKCIEILKRKTDMSGEEFSKYWHENHGTLALRIMPGVRRYVQNHAVKLAGKREPRFDGVAEIWFDDLESWQKFRGWYFSDAGKTLRDDEEKFMDVAHSIIFIAEERVMKA